MEQGQRIRISAHDLIAVLAHSGSVKRAKEFAKESNFSKKEIDQLIETPQVIMNQEEDSEHQLALLKSLGNHILHTNKVIRFENRNKRLFIYPYEGSEVLLEYIHGDQHTFSKFKNLLGLGEVVCDFYGMDYTIQEDPIKINIELSNDLYDSLHNIKSSKLDEMIEDIKYEPKIREFLNDFKWNNQQVSQITFKSRKTKNSNMKVDLAMFFVPGKDYIWHINYDESDKNQLFLMSNSVSQYFNVFEKIMESFYLLIVPSKLKPCQVKKRIRIKRPRNFLLKEGLHFFGRVT